MSLHRVQGLHKDGQVEVVVSSVTVSSDDGAACLPGPVALS